MSDLVLSLFPGVGLLDQAFRSSGFCVVTGPDLIVGGDVREFAAVPNRFDGVMGGPPCQGFSRANRFATDPTHPSVVNSRAMVGEFLRIVSEASPTWFLMENVPCVPDVRIDGYQVQRFGLTAPECGLSAQLRNRHFQFGHCDGWIVRPDRQTVTHRKKPGVVARAVTTKSSSARTRVSDVAKRQGVTELQLPGWTKTAKIKAIGNGVPIPMGRVLAAAILNAGPRDTADCPCDCGRRITGRQRSATAACRKRLQMERRGRRDVIARASPQSPGGHG